jgi:hypothetical protein
MVLLGFLVWLAGPGMAQGIPDRDEAGRGGEVGRLFGELIDRIDPYWGQLTELLGDLSAWHAPEVLPNGDILIRRRQPEAPELEPAPEPPSEPVTDPLEL